MVVGVKGGKNRSDLVAASRESEAIVYQGVLERTSVLIIVQTSYNSLILYRDSMRCGSYDVKAFVSRRLRRIVFSFRTRIDRMTEITGLG